MGTICGVRKADPGRLGRQHQGARQGQFAAAERKLVAFQRLETTGRLAEDPGKLPVGKHRCSELGMVERESARFEIRQGDVDEALLFLDHLPVIVRIEGGQCELADARQQAKTEHLVGGRGPRPERDRLRGQAHQQAVRPEMLIVETVTPPAAVTRDQRETQCHRAHRRQADHHECILNRCGGAPDTADQAVGRLDQACHEGWIGLDDRSEIGQGEILLTCLANDGQRDPLGRRQFAGRLQALVLTDIHDWGHIALLK